MMSDSIQCLYFLGISPITQHVETRLVSIHQASLAFTTMATPPLTTFNIWINKHSSACTTRTLLSILSYTTAQLSQSLEATTHATPDRRSCQISDQPWTHYCGKSSSNLPFSSQVWTLNSNIVALASPVPQRVLRRYRNG